MSDECYWSERLEFSGRNDDNKSGKSSKFWEVVFTPDEEGSTHGVITTSFGKLGTNGQTRSKAGNLGQARAAAHAKKSRGYVSLGAVNNLSPNVAQSAPVSLTVEDADSGLVSVSTNKSELLENLKAVTVEDVVSGSTVPPFVSQYRLKILQAQVIPTEWRSRDDQLLTVAAVKVIDSLVAVTFRSDYLECAKHILIHSAHALLRDNAVKAPAIVDVMAFIDSLADAVLGDDAGQVRDAVLAPPSVRAKDVRALPSAE